MAYSLCKDIVYSLCKDMVYTFTAVHAHINKENRRLHLAIA